MTALRFVAAAMIVVHHAGPGLHHNLLPWDNAVSFFFVLSGFILAHNYPRLDTRREVMHFLVRRIARLWPAHAVVTVAVAIALAMANVKLIANLALVHAWVPVGTWFFSYNSPSWTISTEFFFYLAFVPLIYRWETTFWWKLPICAGSVWLLMALCSKFQIPEYSADTSNVISSTGLLYVNPLARLLEFAAGMAAVLIYRRAARALNGMSVYFFTALEIGALGLAIYVMYSRILSIQLTSILPSSAPQYLGHAATWPAFVPLVVIFALQGGIVSRLLSKKIPVRLGEASYSLYLVHLPIFLLLTHGMAVPLGWSDFILGAAASQAIAFALLLAVEEPTRRWVKRALANRYAVRELQASAA